MNAEGRSSHAATYYLVHYSHPLPVLICFCADQLLSDSRFSLRLVMIWGMQCSEKYNLAASGTLVMCHEFSILALDVACVCVWGGVYLSTVVASVFGFQNLLLFEAQSVPCMIHRSQPFPFSSIYVTCHMSF